MAIPHTLFIIEGIQLGLIYSTNSQLRDNHCLSSRTLIPIWAQSLVMATINFQYWVKGQSLFIAVTEYLRKRLLWAHGFRFPSTDAPSLWACVEAEHGGGKGRRARVKLFTSWQLEAEEPERKIQRQDTLFQNTFPSDITSSNHPSPNTIQPSTSTDEEVTSDPLFNTIIRVKPLTPAILEDVSGQDTTPPPKLTHVGQSPLKAEALSVSPRKLTRRKLCYY